jgi:hypothetical protein
MLAAWTCPIRPVPMSPKRKARSVMFPLPLGSRPGAERLAVPELVGCTFRLECGEGDVVTVEHVNPNDV